MTLIVARMAHHRVHQRHFFLFAAAPRGGREKNEKIQSGIFFLGSFGFFPPRLTAPSPVKLM